MLQGDMQPPTCQTLRDEDGRRRRDGGNPEQSSAIQAAITLGGGVDLAAPFVGDPNQPAPNALIFFGGTNAEKPDLYSAASASTHLDRRAPPMLDDMEDFLTRTLEKAASTD